MVSILRILKPLTQKRVDNGVTFNYEILNGVVVALDWLSKISLEVRLG